MHESPTSCASAAEHICHVRFSAFAKCLRENDASPARPLLNATSDASDRTGDTDKPYDAARLPSAAPHRAHLLGWHSAVCRCTCVAAPRAWVSSRPHASREINQRPAVKSGSHCEFEMTIVTSIGRREPRACAANSAHDSHHPTSADEPTTLARECHRKLRDVALRLWRTCCLAGKIRPRRRPDARIGGCVRSLWPGLFRDSAGPLVRSTD